MISFDGKKYDIIVMNLSRGFSRPQSSANGYLQNGDMFIDPKGTYLNYSITVAARKGNVQELDRFFDDMLSREKFVVVVFPYNQTEITFEAYITQGSHALLDSMRNSPVNTWGPITLEFIARSPVRRPL